MKKCPVSSVVQSHVNNCNQRWHCIKKWFMRWLIKWLARKAARVWLISFNMCWVTRHPSSSNRQHSHLQNAARAWSRHRWCITTFVQIRDDTTFFFFPTMEHPNKESCVCDQYTVWADVLASVSVMSKPTAFGLMWSELQLGGWEQHMSSFGRTCHLHWTTGIIPFLTRCWACTRHDVTGPNRSCNQIKTKKKWWTDCKRCISHIKENAIGNYSSWGPTIWNVYS